MKINIHFLSYLAHFILQWEMIQTNVVEKMKSYIYSPIIFFENCAVYEIK
jgi:hypothetical protein